MEVVAKETAALPAWLRSETSKFSFVKSTDQVNQPRSQDPRREPWERGCKWICSDRSQIPKLVSQALAFPSVFKTVDKT